MPPPPCAGRPKQIGRCSALKTGPFVPGLPWGIASNGRSLSGYPKGSSASSMLVKNMCFQFSPVGFKGHLSLLVFVFM